MQKIVIETINKQAVKKYVNIFALIRMNFIYIYWVFINSKISVLRRKVIRSNRNISQQYLEFFFISVLYCHALPKLPIV